MSFLEARRPRFCVEWKDDVEQLRIFTKKTWLGSAFLSVWLIGWAWGSAKAALLNSQDPMTAAWLIVWIFVLFFTTILLTGQLTGADIVRIHQNELSITRRAGPFSRTWRYNTDMIKNLRVDTSPWTGEDTDGAQYIPFTKQQWGSVRFDYGAETIHLAPHAAAPEAIQIANWLRRRLPTLASC